MMLAPEDIDERFIETSKAFHFGSISRIDEGTRAATDRAFYRVGASNRMPPSRRS